MGRLRQAMRVGLWSFLMAGLAATSPAAAETIEFQDGALPTAGYQGTRDTEIDERSSEKNYGMEYEIKVDGDIKDSGKASRILLKWDVSQIPPGSRVAEAVLTLHCSDKGDSFDLYELKSDWEEAQVTWVERAIGKPWQEPGAGGSEDSGSTMLGVLPRKMKGAQTLQLNSQGVAVVQGWVDDPVANRGLVIRGPNESGAGFVSRESPLAEGRPKLSVTLE